MHVQVCVDLFVGPFGSLLISPWLLQSIRPNYRQNGSQSVVPKKYRHKVNQILNSVDSPCHCTALVPIFFPISMIKRKCNSPLPPVSWALSKQCDWLSKRSEPSFHLGIICRDGYLPGSSTTLEGSERFLLPFADTVFQFQSLPCLSITGYTLSHDCTLHTYI